ncbi:MAG: hypothetical protein F2789_01780 [Actinobacteria bacterium]|nr:hypothetical protein [Actinomycetota bacterium]
MSTPAERTVIGLAAAYVLALGWAMVNVGYDLWGAFVLLPLLLLSLLVAVRRLFSGDLAHLYRIGVVGLGAKFVVVFVRYFVAFQSYAGFSDSGEYDKNAKILAAGLRSGARSPTALIPRGTGTRFITNVTASIYTVFGASRLAGFFVFASMAYVGALLFVKAGILAVPGLSHKRYAALVLLTPSILYWPASIGKESWIMLFLGITTFGVARLLTGRWGLGSFALLGVGLLGVGLVRPHFSGMWIGAFLVALIAGLFTHRSDRGAGGRFGSIALILIGLAALFAVGGATVRFLDQRGATVDSTAGVTTQISLLFDSATQRTDEGRSVFKIVTIDSPLDWPSAIVRTDTRPLLNEARSFAELIPATEMTALLLIAIVSWRRVRATFRVMRRSPYVVFALTVLVAFGLAFASVGNLGILSRQRSLIMPLFVLPLAFPQWVSQRAVRPRADAGRAGPVREASRPGTLMGI